MYAKPTEKKIGEICSKRNSKYRNSEHIFNKYGNSKYIFRGDIVISHNLLISSNYLYLYNPLLLMYLGQFAQYICSVNIGSRAWVPKCMGSSNIEILSISQ